MEYYNLMQTINQLNETIQILQSNIATKDAAITALEQAIDENSNLTILPTEVSMEFEIVVPSLDEIDHYGGKNVKIKQNSYYFKLSRNWERNMNFEYGDGTRASYGCGAILHNVFWYFGGYPNKRQVKLQKHLFDIYLLFFRQVKL